MKKLITTFLAWSFIFQAVAYAAKPLETMKSSAQYKLQLQQTLGRAAQKYESFSDKRKMRVLKRTNRKLKRSLRRIDKISDHTFNKKMKNALKLRKKVQRSKLPKEETEIIASLGIKGDTQNTFFDKDLFRDDIQDSLIAVKDEIVQLEYKISNVQKKLKRMPAAISNSGIILIWAVIIGLVLGSIFLSPVLFVIIGVVALVIGGLFLLRAAFGNALGDIVGQV